MSQQVSLKGETLGWGDMAWQGVAWQGNVWQGRGRQGRGNGMSHARPGRAGGWYVVGGTV